MSTTGELREFLRRSWLVVGAGLLATAGLLYALSAVGRGVGEEALAAAGLAVTLLNIVAVVGAGHGIRLIQTYFSAGRDPDARLQVVRSRSLNARDASLVLVLAWALAGLVASTFVDQVGYFAVAWSVSLPGFVLAPHVAVSSSLMQLGDNESRILRSAVVAVAIELVAISLLLRFPPAPAVLLAAILAAGQLGTVGVLFSYRRFLRRHQPEAWAASRLAGPGWFERGWLAELRLASFTAWDALAIMGYYALAVSLAGLHSASVAAAVAMVASVNRAIIVPLKSAGLVGGRLVRQSGADDPGPVARRQTHAIAAIMLVAAAAVVLVGQFSDPLMGIPTAVGATAFALGGVQLLLEPWVGFASGQGKVLHDSGFGIREITGAVLLVALPLMLLLALLRPGSPVTYVLPFVLARAVALLALRRTSVARTERQAADAA